MMRRVIDHLVRPCKAKKNSTRLGSHGKKVVAVEIAFSLILEATVKLNVPSVAMATVFPKNIHYNLATNKNLLLCFLAALARQFVFADSWHCKLSARRLHHSLLVLLRFELQHCLVASLFCFLSGILAK